MASSFSCRARTTTGWLSRVPENEARLYRQVIDLASELEIPFALGGAFASASYTGCWRDTKDLDIYVLPRDHARLIEVVTSLGFADYYEKLPYDRWWIYRSIKDDVIVDLIWATANHRAQIDDLWLSGPRIDIYGRQVRVLPAEALVWDKLYIMQRERCDWPEVMNLLFAAGADLDWEYLLCRIGEDAELLAGALSVFRWLAPGRAATLPEWLWGRLAIPAPERGRPEVDDRRVSLLDRRAWFASRCE